MSPLSCLTGTARLKAPSQGSALSRKAVWLAGLAALVLVLLMLPAMASAAVCTNTYKGPAEGEWQIAANWSAEHVPTSSDVACVGASETVKVTEGANQTGVLQDEGGLVISGGSLEISNAFEASSTHSLTLSNATLAGAGALEVTSSLAWSENGVMSGSGSTVLGSGATGKMDTTAGCRILHLEGRKLVNEGTVTFSHDEFEISEGARFENKGTFDANSEEECSGAAPIQAAGGGAAPVIVNTGTVGKTVASGIAITKIAVSFENNGAVDAETGTLSFTDGGSSSGSSWSGARLSGGSFTLSGGSLSGTLVVEGGSVTAKGVDAHTAQVELLAGSLEVPKGTTTVSGLTLSNATLLGAGTLDIANSLTWTENGVMSGSGSTVLGSGATGKMDTNAGCRVLHLEGRKLVNEGTTTFAHDEFEMSEGARLENKGTFIANSEEECTGAAPIQATGTGTPPVIVNTGAFEKTVTFGPATKIAVSFENNGTVDAKAGALSFTDGGTSSEGNWSGAKLTAGSFSLKGGSLSGTLAIGATVTAEGVDGHTAQVELLAGSLSIQKGTIIVSGLSLSNATLSGAGTLEVTGTLNWTENGVMSGSGSTVLGPKASGKMDTTAGCRILHLEGRKLVNEGTTTFSHDEFEMSEGARLENKGTFIANSEEECTGAAPIQATGSGTKPVIINTGTLEKTVAFGVSVTKIAVSFENLGIINAKVGRFEFLQPVAAELPTQWGPENPSGPGGVNHACGEPVNCATGNLFDTQTDLAVGGRGVGLSLIRTYNSQAAAAGASGTFGPGWSSSFTDHLSVGQGKAMLYQANGSTAPFTEGKGGSFTPPSWSQDSLSGSAKIGYSLVLANQLKYQFEGSSGKLQSVTDRNGNQTKLAYNKGGLLETITDPAGRKITLTYNGEGFVESAKDPMGNTVKYTYEGGNLASVTEPGEAKARWQYHYDASHQITSVTDGRGGKSTNEYDISHRVTLQTDPTERKLTFEYEPFHTKITNNSTGSITDEHFTSADLPYSITHGFGTASATTETFTYDAANNLTSVADGNNHKTEYTYDSAANRKSMVDPDEHETKWTYNQTHDTLTVTDPNGETTTITRDSHGNAETVSKPAPGKSTQTTTYTYDASGNLKNVVDPLKHTWTYEYNNQGDCTSAADPEGDKRTFAYNEDSQETSTVSPAGNIKGAEASQFTTKIERDARGRPTTVTDPLGHTIKYVYDGNGNVETLTDGNTHTTTYTYNADNRPTKVKEPNTTTIETGYDGAQRVTSQTDGNKHTTTYTRNILGQVVEIKDPLGRVTKKEYDAAGNLTAVTDAAKRTTKYAYDPANRLKEVIYSDGKTPTIKYEYDADGNRTKMTDGTGKTNYTYDVLNRLAQSTDGHGDKAGYEYDLSGNQTKLTYPNGTLITRAYDNAGRLQSVTDPSKNTTTFAYNPNSDLTTTTFPKSTGEQDKITYNGADQQMKITMVNGVKAVAALAYTRDSDGQIKSTITTGLPGTESVSDTYDANNRLEKSGSTAYAYDSADNPTTLGANTSVYDAGNQLKTSGNNIYGYDQLGERVTTTPKGGQATTFGYDQAGNLIQVKQGKAGGLNINYAYDGNGLRTSQTKGKVTSFITWDMHVELPSILSDEQNSYIYGPDNIPIEEIQSKGVILYLHHDQQGSTRMLTSTTGATEATTTYDAYGNVTGTTASPIGYDGQYTNADTGLIYLRARTYDPTTAQFLSVDPIEAITSQPYTYSDDNPLNLFDPRGLSACGDILVISSVCNGLQESGISNAAAGALNVITFGASNELAGDIFGFNSECANYGTAGSIGTGLGFGFGLFDGESEAELASGIGGVIRGYTRHGLAQAMGRDAGRGVSPGAILDAVRSPLSKSVQADGATVYTGQNAIVVVSGEGRVITTRATNSAGLRNRP